MVNNHQNYYFVLKMIYQGNFCSLYIRWFAEKLLPLHPKSAQNVWVHYVKLNITQQYN